MTGLDRGVFTLSLDFELIWGTLDRGVETYREACEREHAFIVDRLLALLAEFEISATWCTLGHLFLESCAPRDGRKRQIVTPISSVAGGLVPRRLMRAEPVRR